MFIPAYVFFALAFKDRPNIPVYDSYNAILQTIIDWKRFGFWDKMALLVRQHNEHRLLASRLFYLAYYYLTGGINFTVIAFIGDLQLFGIALGGIYFIRRAMPKYWLVLSFLWTLTTFDLNGYSNTVVQMQAVANWGILFMPIAAMVCFDKGWCWPGAILQFFTIFSNGNGIPAAVIVTVFCMNGTERNGVEWYKVKYAAYPLLLAPLYYVHFVPNDYHIDIGKSIMFFICSLGAPFSFDYALPWGMLIVTILAIYFPWKTFWKDKSMFPLICIMTFCLVSMLMAAVFRGAASDSQYQASRYLIYAQLVIMITFILLVNRTKKCKLVLAISTVVFILSWGFNCKFAQAMLEIEAQRCYNYKGYRYYYPPVHMQDAIDIAKEACEENIYCINEYR